jgi:hypothetical protein
MNNYVKGGANSWQVGVPQGVPHMRSKTHYPDGANELTMDGAVQWYRIEQTIQITEMDSDYEHDYIYQADLPPTFTPDKIAELQLPPPDKR